MTVGHQKLLVVQAAGFVREETERAFHAKEKKAEESSEESSEESASAEQQWKARCQR